MGHGIAHVASLAGLQVCLYDVQADAAERGLAAVRRNLEQGVEKGKVTEEAMERTLTGISLEPDFTRAVSKADLVVEAAPESLELKQRIFRDLGSHAKPEAILATNTSSLPVGEIGSASGRPDMVVGMHFFNPVHIMPLLEIVRSPETKDSVLQTVTGLAETLGKQSIVVRDVPGFATSRLGLVIGLEAIRMCEQGVASAEDIDKAMTLGYRHPVGPLRLTDMVGLDVRLAISEHLHKSLKSEAFKPPELLRSMVAEGKLGKKSGQGFYNWD